MGKVRVNEGIWGEITYTKGLLKRHRDLSRSFLKWVYMKLSHNWETVPQILPNKLQVPGMDYLFLAFQMDHINPQIIIDYCQCYWLPYITWC